MKKKILVAIMAAAMMSVPVYAEETENADGVEITFRDIPWGTDYETVGNEYPELDFDFENIGEEYPTPSVDAVLSNDDYKDEYEDSQFEKTDINIMAYSYSAINVAGYDVNNVEMYFAYIPVSGEITGEFSDSALYGAKYTIAVEDLQKATDDLIEKLSSLYGEYDETYTDYLDTVYHWSGANDTELTLRSMEYSVDGELNGETHVAICYAWRGGDELLQEASDIQAGKAASGEAEIYGNGSTDGL